VYGNLPPSFAAGAERAEERVLAAWQDPSRPTAGLLNRLASRRGGHAVFQIAVPAPAFTRLD